MTSPQAPSQAHGDTQTDAMTPSEQLEAQRRANEDATAGVAGDVPPAFRELELEDDGMPKPADIENALRAVIDPEIGYNIVDLGLVYEVTKDSESGQVDVLMTLTSMGCPLTEVIHQQCSVILGAMPGVKSVDVEFTFSPPWSPDMMADWVREELRAMGMNV
ncbi:MAG: metal-sulfur cluster assembly factor [Nitriliruptorales bacterium]|nr:metal-sulfur cluster assembly factor [Nitriliruptorales bacterium]